MGAMLLFFTMREFFVNAIDTIRDPRFGWRFKLCNIITNDLLRNYLAVTALILENTENHIKDEFTRKKIAQARNNIRDVFKF